MKFKKIMSLLTAATLSVCCVTGSSVAINANENYEEVSKICMSVGSTVTQNNLLFTELDDGTYEVSYNYDGTKPSGKVTIPKSINGKNVTRIADAGFAYCDKLTGISVPDTVTSVGVNAFEGTPFLKNQTGTVKYAGKVAVYCDDEATSVSIKSGTLGLADKLFYNVENLKKVVLPNSLTNLGFLTFNDCQKLTSVNLPSGLKSIGSGVFAGCTSLASVTIPSGVKTIGEYAFADTKLSSVTIPSGVTKIGKGAFENTKLGKSGVKIGSGYIDIGGRAFANTPFYTSQGDLKYAGSVVIGCNDSVTNAKIKSGTTAIAGMAFINCEKLQSVTIPNTVKTIGDDAFFGCSKLTSVTVPSSVTHIGEDAFRLCKALKNVSLPSGLKSIGDGAFYGCPGHESDSSSALAVTGLKATTTVNSATLTWNKCSIADKYQIDIFKNGKWTYLAKVTGTTYTATNLAANTTYNFRVFAFKGSQYSTSAKVDATTLKSSSSSSTSNKTLAVTGLKATTTTNAVTLSWNKCSIADKYQIDIYKNGKWTYLTKLTGTSYTIKNLSANTTYQFRVFAFKGSQYSSSAKVNATTQKISSSSSSNSTLAVTGLKATSTTANTVTLSWNKCTIADKYQIDVYLNGRWTYLTKLTGTSYTARNLSANTSYQFRVFAFNGSKYSNSARITATTKSNSVSRLAYSANYMTETVSQRANAQSTVYSVNFTGLSGTKVMMKGIDVSGWQGTIDFKQVKESGVDFVIVKAGYSTSTVDTWETNYKNAHDAGLLVGAYWYSTTTTLSGGKKEAQAFIKALSGKQFEFPVYFDLEETDTFNKGKEFCSDLVETFCGELEDAGYFPGVYCSTYWYTKYVNDNVRLKYPTFIADYRDKCGYTGSYGIWQYGNSGTVPGVQYSCDLDWGYTDYSRIIKNKHLNGF